MYRKGEITLVIGVFLFVFCCFSVPIILYATSSDVTPSQEFEIEIDVDNCPQQVYNFGRINFYCLFNDITKISIVAFIQLA